jgi:hypothetical protein
MPDEPRTSSRRTRVLVAVLVTVVVIAAVVIHLTGIVGPG